MKNKYVIGVAILVVAAGVAYYYFVKRDKYALQGSEASKNAVRSIMNILSSNIVEGFDLPADASTTSMDGDMSSMDTSTTSMDGGMTPMDGGMSSMDGGMSSGPSNMDMATALLGSITPADIVNMPVFKQISDSIAVSINFFTPGASDCLPATSALFIVANFLIKAINAIRAPIENPQKFDITNPDVMNYYASIVLGLFVFLLVVTRNNKGFKIQGDNVIITNNELKKTIMSAEYIKSLDFKAIPPQVIQKMEKLVSELKNMYIYIIASASGKSVGYVEDVFSDVNGPKFNEFITVLNSSIQTNPIVVPVRFLILSIVISIYTVAASLPPEVTSMDLCAMATSMLAQQ